MIATRSFWSGLVKARGRRASLWRGSPFRKQSQHPKSVAAATDFGGGGDGEEAGNHPCCGSRCRCCCYSQTALPAPSAFATCFLYMSFTDSSSSSRLPGCEMSDKDDEGDLQVMAEDSVRDGAEDCEGVRDAQSWVNLFSLESGPEKLELLGRVRKESSCTNGRWLAELLRCTRC